MSRRLAANKSTHDALERVISSEVATCLERVLKAFGLDGVWIAEELVAKEAAALRRRVLGDDIEKDMEREITISQGSIFPWQMK